MKELPHGRFTLRREQKLFWSDRWLPFMAFIVPFVILASAYAALQVFPFGNRHMLTVDLFHQYAPFFSLFRDKILQGGSFFYAPTIGLGTNFYALFAYYLASPINLLLLVFPASCLTEAIFSITLIKIGLSGLSFYLYLRTSFRRKGALAVAFSTFYALSGFVIAYSWNIMWLDALILLPVLLLAIVRHVRDGKWILYPVSVALLLITNYYVAFFAAIFTALYYPILLLRYTGDRQHKKRLVKLLQTLGLTLIGVGLSAVVLYPTWKSLMITSAAGDAFPKSVELLGRPLAYLGQLFPFLQPTVRSGSPNLYSGLFILILLPIYFLSHRIRLRDKLLNGLLLLFLFLSFDTNVLNFIWHGMHYPNQLPFRYSFVVILLLLTLAYDGLRSTREFRPTEIGLLGISLAIIIPVVMTLEPDIKLSPWSQWGAIVLMLLYTILFSSFKSSRFRRRFHVNLLLAVMLFEVTLSVFSGLYHIDKNEYYGSRDGYSAGITVQSIREAVRQVEKLDATTISHRVETRPHKTSNDPALYGYKGLSMFSSSSPKAPVKFFKNLGHVNNGINSYQYRGATLFTEALFDIRYVIAREKPDFLETERIIVLGNEEVTVYENPYAFPQAFLTDPSVLAYESTAGNPFRAQNDLVKALSSDAGTLFHEMAHDEVKGPSFSGPGSGGVSFSFTESKEKTLRTYTITWVAKRTEPHYLNLDLHGHDTETVEVDYGATHIKVKSHKRGIVELGTIQEGQAFRLTVTLSEKAPATGNFEARVASLDPEVLENVSIEARQAAMHYRTEHDDWFEGNINAEGESVLLLTMPYDPGWTAYLDEEPVDIEQVDDALMAIRVPKGDHRIFFAFLPVGFNEGLMVTLGALLLFVILMTIQLALRVYKKEWSLPVMGRFRRNNEDVSLTEEENDENRIDEGESE